MINVNVVSIAGAFLHGLEDKYYKPCIFVLSRRVYMITMRLVVHLVCLFILNILYLLK
ncbi:hypothetical protein HanXRQr2_Chr13g0611521 [Helianthus annuus]|uniref:Uncharacterized protein n=1 Tax=Helianthus annuus TaxID=4232 RepID=A0A9K3HE76_HELAN|nr:hypothetical protein HanXRQr2_Chr13g0611521 [Helianthus annuus]